MAAGDGLGKSHDVQIAPQIGKTHGRRFVAEHEAVRAHQPRELTGLAARTGTHVEHGGSLRRIERYGRQHGGPVLNVDEAEESGETVAQRTGPLHETPGGSEEGVGFEAEALKTEHFLNDGNFLRGAGEAEGAACCCHGGNTVAAGMFCYKKGRSRAVAVWGEKV